jgi:N-acyl-D-amino-acid deacylase
MIRRLELVRDFRLRTMEQSIRNVTREPAEVLKLGDHGLLKEGWDANVTIMDYDKLHATADYIHPHRKSEGIHYVLVNGKMAVRNGDAISGVRAGKILKRQS